jgi:hypothetical protein
MTQDVSVGGIDIAKRVSHGMPALRDRIYDCICPETCFSSADYLWYDLSL